MANLVAAAEAFAKKAHAGIIRPNKAREPYENHLREVAYLVALSGGSDEEIAAGWLHDSVEDTEVTQEEIRSLFGAIVASIVHGLTDPPEFTGLSTLMRKARQAERVRGENTSVKRVKLADQTSNVRSVAVDPPVHWSKQKCLDYIEGARGIAEECREVSALLDHLFAEAHQAALRACE